MSDFAYEYTKSPVAVDALEQQIRSSAIVYSLRHATLLGADQLTVTMANELSEEDETLLHSIVTAHDGVSLVYAPSSVALGEPKDAKGRLITSASAFAVNTDYEVKATGFKGVAAGGVVTNIHHAIGIEDRYINGLEIFSKGAVMDDTIELMVTDQDNLLGYGAGLILKQFGFTWNIDPDKTGQGLILFNYLARVPAGFYLRVRYTSTGESSVKVACNLALHKKVV